MTVIDPTTSAEPEPSTPDGTGPGRRAARWARAHPGMVVALLVPVLVFGLPQLFGGTYLTGDNLIQNLPMRALVGRDLDHAIWPLWNPYLFSGTPLLGGFNAGAAYPVTWLTAVLPLFTVWTLTLVVAYDVALVGMYVFLRRQPMSSPAATLGAVTFAFAGYMTAQMVHIDLIEGASWLPWMLVAVHALTGGPDRSGTDDGTAGRDAAGDGTAGDGRRTGWGRARRWMALLAAALGMSLLSGTAEAVVDSGVLVGVYWIGRLVSQGLLRRDARRALAASVAAVLGGLAGGIALGAAQWLPGLIFLSQSQRSMSGYAFFSSGALDNRLLPLQISPFLLGTNQTVPGMYVGSYNFPEVTGYMGILALIAACSLFLRRWRTRPEARQWWVWYAVLVVGLLSAMGGDTPFGRLMYAVPGINSERLTNRNLLLVDFALAALSAWWFHVLLEDRAARPAPVAPVRGRWRSGGRSEVVVTCAPLAVMVALAALLWADQPLLGRLMDMQYTMSRLVRVRVSVLVTVQVLVAAWATWVVLARRRFSATTLARLLTAVLAVDLVLFNLFVIQPPVSKDYAQAKGPAAAGFRALVGDGRFIIYDPDRLYGDQLIALGQTDLNIYGRLPSAQGYTALTDGSYFGATGSHYQEDLNPESLAGSVWDGLNVTTLLSVPGYFVTPVPTPGAPAAHPVRTVQYPNDLGGYRASPKPSPDTFALAAGASRRWYFGGTLTVRAWDVPVLAGPSDRFRVGLVTTTGALRWLPAGDATVTGTGTGRTLRVTMARPTPAGGIVVQSAPASPSVVGVPQASTTEGGEVALDGRMQFGVTDPHWVFAGSYGPFGVFHNTDTRGWAYLDGVGGGAPPAGSSVTVSAPDLGGGSTVGVHASSAVALVRSAAFSPGWQATVRAVHSSGGRSTLGPPSSVPVTADGVLQRVAIPSAGDYQVTFAYSPAPAKVGILVSGLAAVALAALGLVELAGVRRRRRRRGQPQSGASRPMASAARR